MAKFGTIGSAKDDALVSGWANFTTVTTTAINDSFNVTSLTDNAPGDTIVTWATDFAGTAYAVSVKGQSAWNSRVVSQDAGTTRVATSDTGFNSSSTTRPATKRRSPPSKRRWRWNDGEEQNCR